jgi:hypothetical protein
MYHILPQTPNWHYIVLYGAVCADDAARMCTDIPSTQVIQHMQLCHRLLPRGWGSEEASRLCESTTSREQTEAALKCAVEGGTRYVVSRE